jgi:hypothetical protein
LDLYESSLKQYTENHTGFQIRIKLLVRQLGTLLWAIRKNPGLRDGLFVRALTHEDLEEVLMNALDVWDESIIDAWSSNNWSMVDVDKFNVRIRLDGKQPMDGTGTIKGVVIVTPWESPDPILAEQTFTARYTNGRLTPSPATILQETRFQITEAAVKNPTITKDVLTELVRTALNRVEGEEELSWGPFGTRLTTEKTVHGSRLAVSANKPENFEQTTPHKPQTAALQDTITFITHVVSSNKRFTKGQLVLGDALLDITIDHTTHTLLIYGLSKDPVRVDNFELEAKRALLNAKAQTTLTVSMSDLRQKLNLDTKDTKALLNELAPVLSNTHELVFIDLDTFSNPKLKPYLTSLLLLKLYALHKHYKNNIAVLVEGDTKDIESLTKESLKRYPNEETPFYTDPSQVPLAFKESKAHVSLLPAKGRLPNRPGSFIYVDTLEDQSILDISRLLDIAILAGVVGHDPKTTFFQKFLLAYESLLGRSIKPEELSDFLGVLEGRIKTLKTILLYAAKPHAIDIQYTLRVYQLMQKMAQQAA